MTDTKREAPAEGASEVDVLVTMRDHYQFALTGPWPDIKTPNYALAGLFKMAGDEIERLRARSSSPEAREGEAVAWMRLTAGRITHLTHCEMPGYVPLYTHPAAPSADKLRIAVVALEKARAVLNNTSVSNALRIVGSYDVIDQALATLEAEAVK